MEVLKNMSEMLKSETTHWQEEEEEPGVSENVETVCDLSGS